MPRVVSTNRSPAETIHPDRLLGSHPRIRRTVPVPLAGCHATNFAGARLIDVGIAAGAFRSSLVYSSVKQVSDTVLSDQAPAKALLGVSAPRLLDDRVPDGAPAGEWRIISWRTHQRLRADDTESGLRLSSGAEGRLRELDISVDEALVHHLDGSYRRARWVVPARRRPPAGAGASAARAERRRTLNGQD
jgi:hypothetical protein